MYCTKCGAELPDDANFCSKCGTPVTEAGERSKANSMANKSVFRFQSSKLQLMSDSIRYKGRDYPYHSVIHLGRLARRSSVNFIPVGEYLRITIYIKGLSEPIKLDNNIGIIGTTRRIKKAYQLLVERTFETRLNSYLLELEKQDYFQYGDARFYRSGEVTIGSKKFSVKTSRIFIKPFAIIFRDQGLFGEKEKISTEIDQDVFFALLEAIYGVTFK